MRLKISPRGRTTQNLAAVVWLLSVGLLIAAPVVDVRGLLVMEHFALPHALAFSTVGAVLASRRPQNPIGWLFVVWGFVSAYMVFADSYVRYGLTVPGSLPGTDWVAWVGATVWHPAYSCLIFTMLLFPTGHLASRRWRPFALACVAYYVMLAISAALSITTVTFYFPGVQSPLRLPGGAIADRVFESILAGNLVLLAVALVAPVVRVRLSSGEQRQQIKWFVYTVALTVIAFLTGMVVFGRGVLYPLFAAIPVAAGVAILKYRLYDIDRIISRTLAYGLLTALLVAVYVAGVVGLGQVLPIDSDLAVAGSTLAVAALFGPGRRRLQAGVDRRFNRERYDAARIVGSFSSELRHEVDLEQISDEVLAVAGQTMQPARVALWLRPTGGM